jgi:hypothetical protein
MRNFATSTLLNIIRMMPKIVRGEGHAWGEEEFIQSFGGKAIRKETTRKT